MMLRDHAHDMEKMLPGITQLFNRYIPRATGVTSGRNRVVFHMGRYVVKLPMNYGGVADNDWEGSVRHSQDPREAKYARTRMVYFGEIPVVFMEYVKSTGYSDLRNLGPVPKWVDGIDCQQVGFNRRGQLVAYDYGIR